MDVQYTYVSSVLLLTRLPYRPLEYGRAAYIRLPHATEPLLPSASRARQKQRYHQQCRSCVQCPACSHSPCSYFSHRAGDGRAVPGKRACKATRLTGSSVGGCQFGCARVPRCPPTSCKDLIGAPAGLQAVCSTRSREAELSPTVRPTRSAIVLTMPACSP